MNSPIGYGTGALQEWDAKNADYPVAALLDPVAALTSRRWELKDTDRINQGQDPFCVGASLGQDLAADPVPVPISHPHTMVNIYNLAQRLDEWPGEGYPGTSLLAGLKALKQYGYIGGYNWAANVEEVALAVSQLGPMAMAGPWLTGMFTPTSEGRIPLTGTAGNIGHAYLFGEVDAPKARFYVEQTWGPNWSVLGWRGWIPFEDVQRLMSMGTQAAIITGRVNPDVPQPQPGKTKTAQLDVYSNGEVVLTK